MPSRLDPSATDLRIGDWFTTEDEFDSRPGFLRDHDESYFRAHRPDSCPPPGVPMRLIARHENYLYASAMSWNGQEWCPAIVDLRRHEVVPLPKSIPDAIKGHLERERRKNMQRQQKPQAQATEKSRRTLAREQAEGQQAAQQADAEKAAAGTAAAASDKVHTPSEAPAPAVESIASDATIPPDRRTDDQQADTAWIRLSVNPGAVLRSLTGIVRTLNPRRSRDDRRPSG